jgi:hypothetical protein
MESTRLPHIRPVLIGLAVSFALGAAGCSGDSGRSGTQAPIQEADKKAQMRSAEVRLERMKEAKARAKLPRSKQSVGD